MRKLLSLALVVVLVVSLAAACAPKTEPVAAPAPTAYKDGTYTAKGETDDRGWTPMITITVAGGKITEVKYDEATGLRKTDDAEYKANFMNTKKVDIVASFEAMQKALIDKQDVETVDVVAGATGSFTKFKELAAKAMENAKDGDKFKDGEYRAVGAVDDRGWQPIIAITVEAGKITAVNYNEMSAEKLSYKSQDAAYRDRFLKVKNVDIVAAYEALQKSLVEKQDPAAVDTYAGATHAYDEFVLLAAKALEQAK